MAFNRKSTAEQVTEGLDLSGKTIVITGVNSGLGLESMRVLCLRGAHVIGLARNMQKAQEACDSVAGQATPVACELSDLASVKAAGEGIRHMAMPIDVLITNAGIMAPNQLSHAHGLEMQFVTNHIGHFVLIQHLLDQVKRADAGRIVILSSYGHTMTVKGGIDFDNLDASHGYSPWRFYGQSKLANLLTARYMASQLKDSGVMVNSVHPGVIQTNLTRYAGGLLMTLMGIFAKPIEKTVEQGAATQCYVAVNPEAAAISGEYFSNCAVAKTTAAGRNALLAEELWKKSEELARDYLPGTAR
jgi:WW domain-containing oxidoreductase